MIWPSTKSKRLQAGPQATSLKLRVSWHIQQNLVFPRLLDGSWKVWKLSCLKNKPPIHIKLARPEKSSAQAFRKHVIPKEFFPPLRWAFKHETSLHRHTFVVSYGMVQEKAQFYGYFYVLKSLNASLTWIHSFTKWSACTRCYNVNRSVINVREREPKDTQIMHLWDLTDLLSCLQVKPKISRPKNVGMKIRVSTAREPQDAVLSYNLGNS